MDEMLIFITKLCGDRNINIYAKGNRELEVDNSREPYDITGIPNFPIRKSEEIKKIQEVIENLLSQERKRTIDTIIPVVDAICCLLVNEGSTECSWGEIFTVYHGKIYKI